jgi:hypothetical protein
MKCQKSNMGTPSYEEGGSTPTGVPFSNMRTTPSRSKRQKFNKNKDSLNLRVLLEELARRKDFKDNEVEESSAAVDYSVGNEDKPAMPEGDCADGKCSAYDVDSKDLADMSSGDSDEREKNIFKVLASMISNQKENKRERLLNRKDRLNSDWRQGIGSKENGMTIENPINNIRQLMTNTQIAKLNARHPAAGRQQLIRGSF